LGRPLKKNHLGRTPLVSLQEEGQMQQSDEFNAGGKSFPIEG
jgi:hypothetical protein